ncbi:LacI family DNA-binding transcriptional regulator [Microbacterium sp. G2-8]|uniref:LacI family DNA-binding transcriptional regulator n=1 Tax=Microbacterium sp. G2-8 TaxID=2842454 RepID=UPI001C8B0399|nr:LacI family DNA-binding transcriptional regulator [Microbacterium sp. G2-8]
MAGSRPTLADIAEAAGVSVPTVSKAIAGRSDVAQKTRQRVLEAMHDLGYLARPTWGGGDRHGVIELLIGGIGSLWAIEIVRGAEDAAARYGKSLVLTNANREGFSIDDWIDATLSHKAAGAIIATTQASDGFARLVAAGIPIVRLDSLGVAGTGEAQVGATNWAGMRSATQHLLDLGHTRIGLIGGKPGTPVAHDRFEGYSAALRRAGIPVDPALTFDGDFMVAGGEAGAQALLDLEDPPTAIAAASDLEAMGVYHVAQARGLRIPDDLSVVGFDDTLLCEYLSPPLTTVRQPLAQMAEQTVRLLMDHIHDGPPAHSRIELSTVLVERSSTGVPAQR